MSINCLCGDKRDSEVKRDPLLTILIVLFVIILIVSVGTIGFHVFGKQNWIDSFVNGALMFTSTTLVTPVYTYHGKIFAAIYNIISAVLVLVLLTIILRGAFHLFDVELSARNNSINNTNGNGNNCCCNCQCRCHNKKIFDEQIKIPSVFDI